MSKQYLYTVYKGHVIALRKLHYKLKKQKRGAHPYVVVNTNEVLVLPDEIIFTNIKAANEYAAKKIKVIKTGLVGLFFIIAITLAIVIPATLFIINKLS